MNPSAAHLNSISRRSFIGLTGLGIGAMAARTLLAADTDFPSGGKSLARSHFAPKAKRVIYLFQSGGPSHIDLFDYKPHLENVHGPDLPDSVRQGQRLTGMTSGQKNFPVCKSLAEFKQRGLLEDTLVIWGGEFGRTVYSQGKIGEGRDHNGRCFSSWVAGGGVKGGVSHGLTDDYSYNIVENPVHIRDLNATILHCLGMDHNRFTFRSQGLNQKPTGVEPAHVVQGILA